MMRRQNHSCDQCRKAKRACDAPSLREHLHRSAMAAATAGGTAKLDLDHVRCSYCTKTHKECTLNWALSQLHATRSSSTTRSNEHRRQKRSRAGQEAASAGAESTSSGASSSGGVGGVFDGPAFPSPPDSSSATMHTASEMGDVTATTLPMHPAPAAAAAASVPMAYWGPDAFAPSLPDLSPYPDPANHHNHTHPHHPQQHAHHNPHHHNTYLGGSGGGDAMAHLGFGDPASASMATAHHGGLMGLPFDNLPLGSADLVSRPAFHPILPDQTAAWAVVQEPTHMDVGGGGGSSSGGAGGGHGTLPPSMGGEPLAHMFRTDVFSDGSGGDGSQETDPRARQQPRSVASSAAALQQQQYAAGGYPVAAYTTHHGGGGGGMRAAALSLMPPSPSTTEYLMGARINNNSISENLLQIYHDVLEHNLTCWITEETCPYNVWARPPKRKSVAGAIGSSSSGSSGSSDSGSGGNGGGSVLALLGGRRSWAPVPQYREQFGPQWSNRMYRRVTKLDRTAQAAGIMRLSRAQHQASQKALHLAIMAFATQWAQASRRQAETYQPAAFAAAPTAFPGYGVGSGTTGSPSDEFDRQIQRHLWQQARQALQDCADIESYRVVCAEIIFSLTQRPWEEDEFVELGLAGVCGDPAGPLSPDQAQAKRAAILAKLKQIHEKDGPPIFLERAARKIHTLKQTFDNYELGLLGDRHPAADQPAPALSEESQTVGLLFWMAAMFDTISASMTERPVVLADDESQHEAAEHDRMFPEPRVAEEEDEGADNGDDVDDGDGDGDGAADGAAITTATTTAAANARKKMLRRKTAATTSSTRPHNRWRIDLFIQDDPERSSYAYVRWPCAYDEAVRMVTRATPVKVLLYRYVGYLQSMLRKPYVTRGAPLEEILSETLLVYRYWQVTYAAFFRDLIEHHQTVPARIRGWFVCILAHWHLGALLLADVIELADDCEAGLPAARRARRAAQTVARIRRSSAAQLADLAHIATPMVNDGRGMSPATATPEPQMPNFHVAVREGTVLTEPWTILLIRSFARAAVLHLQDVDALRQQQHAGADLLGHHADACRESLRRCEECVQALWYLGKKSDMARNVAAVLFKAMHV